MSTTVTRESNDSVVVLREVSWQTYCELRKQESNHKIKMTFDRGRLFLMSPGRLHEHIGELLAQMIHVWTEEQGIPRMSGGSTTMRSELLERGLEPDKCFYIQNEAKVRGTIQYDAENDPPPDLVIEVDVTSLCGVKLPIYAEFGVPEIWRWSDERLILHRLQGNAYSVVDQSVCLANFPISKCIETLGRRHELDETCLIGDFRKFCQSFGNR